MKRVIAALLLLVASPAVAQFELDVSTAFNRPVLMIDSSDHVTGKTGLTLTITASKDAGAFASITPTVTELATGWYKLALTTSHTDTLGALCLHITGTGADPTDVCDQVFPVSRKANVIELNGSSADVTDLKDLVANGYDDTNNVVFADVKRLDTSVASLSDLKDFADDGYDPTGNVANADLKLWLTVAPLALNGQRVESRFSACATNVLTDTCIATGAIGGDQLAGSAGDEIGNALLALPLPTGAAVGTVGQLWSAAHTGTAQAGTSTTITLAASASAQNNRYINATVSLTDGTGAQQQAQIISYNGTTKVATISGIWAVAPDATTEYIIERWR